MLVAIYEEIWPWPVQNDSQPTIRGPVGVADGYEKAHAVAQRESSQIQTF